MTGKRKTGRGMGQANGGQTNEPFPFVSFVCFVVDLDLAAVIRACCIRVLLSVGGVNCGIAGRTRIEAHGFSERRRERLRERLRDGRGYSFVIASPGASPQLLRYGSMARDGVCWTKRSRSAAFWNRYTA
jgi:hypothetical protein